MALPSADQAASLSMVNATLSRRTDLAEAPVLGSMFALGRNAALSMGIGQFYLIIYVFHSMNY